MEDNKWCVYVHTNKTNGKMYVGITSQIVERRWAKGLGYYKNKHFAKSIAKYGWEGFYHTVLVDELRKDDALFYESQLIKKLELTNPKKGYNICTIGTIHTHSEKTKRKISDSAKKIKKHGISSETREKISNSMKNHFLQMKEEEKLKRRSIANAATIASLKSDKLNKVVYQYDLDGVLIGKHKSIKQTKEAGYTPSKVSSCCNGKIKSYKNSIWTFTELDEIEKLRLIESAKTHLGRIRKHYYQYKLDGSLNKIYSNPKELVSGEFSPNRVRECCRGEKSTYKGYIWSYQALI